MRIPAVVVIVVLTLAGAIALSCNGPHTKSVTMDINPSQGEGNNSTVIETSEDNIWHLNLIITGEVNGSGHLSISSDSTTYKVFEMRHGPVNIHFDGDWYSKICLVKFKPDTLTSGQLTIKADFTGK
jgi:hypothetical protein